MRLAITTPFLETRGGMERVILQIAQRFNARIHCLSYDADNTFQEFSKLDIEVAKPTFLRSLPFGRRVSSAIEAGNHFYNTKLEDYDVINAHQTPSEWIANKNSPVIWYCLHEDTPILKMTKGGLVYSSIKELNIGDHVHSFDNRMNAGTAEVLKIRKRHATDLRIVRLRNGRELITTPEHRFFVFDKAGNMAVKHTQELQPTDRLPIPTTLPVTKRPQKSLDVKKLLTEKFGEHPYWKNRLFVSFDGQSIAAGNRKVLTLPSTIKVTKELMRFLGYYVSEGYLYFRHSEKREDMQVGLSFGIHEDELVRDAVSCIKKSLCLESKVKRVPQRSEIIVILPNIAALLILALGCGAKSRVKRVPDLVFRSTRQMQEEFLKAYLAGDGHFYQESKRWRAVTVSPSLANSLIYAFSFTGRQAGVIRRRAHKFNNYNERLNHQIYALDIPMKRKRYEKRGDLLLVPVKEVLPLQSDASTVYDIEVSGNHSFLAGDCIYTHNCHTPNREAFDLYEWRMKKRNPLSKAVFWSSIQAFKFFEYRTVPKLEHIFTNSLNSQGRIKKYLHRDSEVLHPGVDIERFSCKGYEDFFFYPSRIVPEKDIEYAIEAFKIFRKRTESWKQDAGNWKLVITGALSKRPEHLAYLKKLKSLCDDSITIETNVGDWQLRDFYARCRAVLYTPVNEDYGLVPLEAMASSKPCIARNEGGPKETIIDGTDGYLINSIWEMADRMERLAKDENISISMGKAGRSKVQKQFTWESFLKRFGEKAEELARANPR